MKTIEISEELALKFIESAESLQGMICKNDPELRIEMQMEIDEMYSAIEAAKRNEKR